MGITYWITGLSGAGKTTIGKLLYEYIKKYKKNIVFLDGDVLRQVYHAMDYSKEARIKLTYQNARLCKMLNEQDIDVVICLIAMYDACREWNRKNIQNYKEIYLKVTIKELIKRDQKGLYSRAIKNEIQDVLGINCTYEEPKNPDLCIDNSGKYTPEEVLEIIVKNLGVYKI